MSLAGPFEFWDFPAGETRVVQVESWAEGIIEIEPRYPNAPARKRIDALRLYLKEGIKETLPYYWDITAKHLIAGLKAYLMRGDYKNKEFTITKHGSAPRARFSLAVRNLE